MSERINTVKENQIWKDQVGNQYLTVEVSEETEEEYGVVVYKRIGHPRHYSCPTSDFLGVDSDVPKFEYIKTMSSEI